jgi:hypothetical protein
VTRYRVREGMCALIPPAVPGEGFAMFYYGGAPLPGWLAPERIAHLLDCGIAERVDDDASPAAA